MSNMKLIHLPALTAARLESVMNGKSAPKEGITPEQMMKAEADFKATIKPYRMATVDGALKKLAGGGKSLGSTGVSQKQDVVSVIPIIGCLSKYSYIDWWAWEYVLGTQDLIQEISDEANEADVKAIVLYFDTPGGDVDGIFELGEVIRKINTTKPIIACVSGTCASGGYWLATQCSKVYVTSPQSEVGSIGVFMLHTDASVMMETLIGIKQTYVVSTDTPNKVVAPSNAPLSPEDEAKLLRMIDPVKADFVKAVKSGRGDRLVTDQPTIFQGGVFMAKDAKAWGMIDGVKSFDDIVMEAQIDGNRVARATKNQKSAKKENSKNMGLLDMLGLNGSTKITEDQTLSPEEANTLHASFTNLQSENGKLTEQTKSQASEIETLKANATVLDTEKSAKIVELEAKIAELETKAVASDTTELQAEVTELETKVAAASELEAKIKAEAEANATMKAEVEKLKAENANLLKRAGASPQKVKAEGGDPEPGNRPMQTKARQI